MSNENVFILNQVTYTCGANFLSDTYVQSYLVLLGLSVSQIGLYGTLSSAGALLAYFAFMFYKPARGSYFPSFLISSAALVIMPAALIAAPALSDGKVMLYVLFAAVLLYKFAMGIRGSADYSVVPSLFDRNFYGRILSFTGIIGSGMSAIMSALNLTLLKRTGIASCRVLFICSIALFVFSAVCIRFFHPYETPYSVEKPDASQRKSSLISHFTRRNLYLLLPHLLRGLTTAGFYYYMVLSMKACSLPDKLQPLIVIVGVLGSAAGCFVFGRLDRYIATGKQSLGGFLLTALCAVAACLNKSPVLFFVLYFLYMFAMGVSDYSIPAGVMYLVPGSELPFISSARMLAMTVSTMLMIPVWGKLAELMPAAVMMGICALIHIFNGVLFMILHTDPLRRR